jgi:hypothetical protein
MVHPDSQLMENQSSTSWDAQHFQVNLVECNQALRISPPSYNIVSSNGIKSQSILLLAKYLARK